MREVYHRLAEQEKKEHPSENILTTSFVRDGIRDVCENRRSKNRKRKRFVRSTAPSAEPHETYVKEEKEDGMGVQLMDYHPDNTAYELSALPFSLMLNCTTHQPMGICTGTSASQRPILR